MLWPREFKIWDCPFAQGNDLRARAVQCPNQHLAQSYYRPRDPDLQQLPEYWVRSEQE
jgi:hypothetical protein